MRNNDHDTIPENEMEHGRRLSSFRLRAGLTQSDIAKRIAVSRQHISNIETGTTSPTLRVLQKYLEVCGTTLAEFFYGPLPFNQTPQQREYHRRLQALLEDDTTAPVLARVLDAFMISTQASLTAAVQPIRVQAREARPGSESTH
jgi:transcriptional regulator with XRE-family HTH domain